MIYRPRVALPAALFLAAALLAACSSTGSGTPPPSGTPCIVADADEHPGRGRRQAPDDPVDQFTFGEGRDGARLGGHFA